MKFRISVADSETHRYYSPTYRRRILPIAEQLAKKSVFLLGARRTGKSTLVRHQLPGHTLYNLLHADVLLRLSVQP